MKQLKSKLKEGLNIFSKSHHVSTKDSRDMDARYDLMRENKKGALKQALHFGKTAIC